MKKKYGQNFLKNNNVVSKIMEVSNINKKSIVYEIGPGNGVLTKEIINKNPKQFLSIEIDKSLSGEIDKFFSKKNHNIIYDNALSFNEENFFKKEVIIIGNLPYNISVKLLIKWITQYSNNKWFKKMILMFQKEVADRIIAVENTKKYGRLTLLCSAFFKVTKILDISKFDFYPIPKVESTLLEFTPHKIPKINQGEFEKLEYLSKLLFANRRKKLKKKIIQNFNSENIEKHKLNDLFDKRVEEIKMEKLFSLLKIL